jgi:Fe-Mn family superoxide dismutase
MSGLLLLLFSCNNKKLTEVVEVPLPSKEEKMLIGSPEDVKAEDGAFKMLALPYSYEALAPHIDALDDGITLFQTLLNLHQ